MRTRSKELKHKDRLRRKICQDIKNKATWVELLKRWEGHVHGDPVSSLPGAAMIAGIIIQDVLGQRWPKFNKQELLWAVKLALDSDEIRHERMLDLVSNERDIYGVERFEECMSLLMWVEDAR